MDNDTEGRFDASPGWSERSGDDQYGDTYAYSGGSSSAAPARFKVEAPATGTYSVYARWPAREGNSATTRFGVSTTTGIEWTEVDQRTDGGFWVKLGAYEWAASDSIAAQVAHSTGGSGEVVADAVMVLSGERANPDEVAGEATTVGADGRRVTGRDVVRKARSHFKTPYVASPPGRCKAYRKEDCSCHTKVVFRRFGRALHDNPVRQWKVGKRVKKRSNLRPGDLVFFDEDRNRRLTP